MFTPLSKGSERRQYREWDGELPLCLIRRIVRPGSDIDTKYAHLGTENPTTPDKNRSIKSRASFKSRSSRQPLSPFRAPNPRNITPTAQKRKPRGKATPNRHVDGLEDDQEQDLVQARKVLTSEPKHGERRKSLRSRFIDLFLLPPKPQVENWLSTWAKRNFVLVVAPCLFVWVWVAVPFPTRTHDEGNGGVGGGIGRGDAGEGIKIIEPSFAFFLFFYYGQSQSDRRLLAAPPLIQCV